MSAPETAPESAPASAVGRPRPRLSRRRRVQFALVTLALLMLGGVVALEAFARVATRLNLVHFGSWEALPGVRFKLRGGEPGFNSQGFRDVERPFEKPDGVYRVLFLGDSYVWGTVDYAHNFPTLLEQQLNALAPSKRIELINLGVPSYGPLESYELWRHFGVRYQPDAVIFGFFYGNDLTDSSRTDYWRTVLGERVKVRHGSTLDRSKLLLFLRARWNLLVFAVTHPGQRGEPGQDDAAMQAATDFHAYFCNPAHRGELQPLLDHTGEILDLMATQAREQKTPLFVMRYPSELMVSPALQAQSAARQRAQVGDFDFGLLGREVGALLEARGLPTADITPQIAAGQATQQLYHGSHWNVPGNALAAQAMLPAVRDFLTSNGLVFGAK